MGEKKEWKNIELNAQKGDEEIALETTSKSDVQNVVQNEIQNGLENADKTPQSGENTTNSSFSDSDTKRQQNATENAKENGEKIEEEQGENKSDEPPQDDEGSDINSSQGLEDNKGLLDDMLDFGEPVSKKDDPLNNVKQEPTTTVAKEIEKIKKVGKRSASIWKRISDTGFKEMDTIKAQLCAKISGRHAAHYVSDDSMRDILIDALMDYFEEVDIAKPTPGQTLLVALAMWIGLPVLDAGRHRFFDEQQKLEEETPVAPTPQETPVVPINKPKAIDYSQTKEYKDNRRSFKLHATNGCYNSLPNGTFCKISVADEKPSPEVQALIDQGLTNPEIRKIIYGE